MCVYDTPGYCVVSADLCGYGEAGRAFVFNTSITGTRPQALASQDVARPTRALASASVLGVRRSVTPFLIPDRAPRGFTQDPSTNAHLAHQPLRPGLCVARSQNR